MKAVLARCSVCLAVALLIAAVVWPVGAQEEASGGRLVTLGASGDMMAHITVVQAGQEHGFGHVFGELGALITEDEIAFLNLETPLSVRIDPVSASPPVMGAPPEIAQALSDVGIDVVSLANNHAFDQGGEGLVETLDALEAADVAVVGAATDRESAPGPYYVERNGVRVAFVGFTALLNRPARQRRPTSHVAFYREADVRNALTEARAHADLVVLSMHWSVDFVERPTRRHRRNAARFVEEGADVILAHGPHVLQRVVRVPSPRGEAVIAYSLGNLVSNQGGLYVPRMIPPTHLSPAAYIPTSRDGIWLRTRMRVHEGRVTVDRLEGYPLWTHNNHRARRSRRTRSVDVRIRPLAHMDDPLRSERRAAIADALGDAVHLIDPPAAGPRGHE